MKIPKFFLAALVINICLLVAYEVIYVRDLFDFTMKMINPDSMVLWWSPFVIDMPFGVHSNGTYGDGVAWMPNYIFFILVGMVCFNLIVIGVIEQKALRQRTITS